jgi:hypothetical protein
MIDNFCIIVGAMKCGTTSLFNYLAQHPEIAPCKIKEPNYFTHHFEKGFGWYCSQWDWDANRHRVAVEASTAYSKVPVFANAADRIARAPGHFRFIYSVRNPLDAIESAYTHGRVQGWPELEVPLDVRIPPGLLTCVRYATQLGEYRQRFGKDSILVIDYQEFDRQPLQVLERICNFVGIAANHAFDVSVRLNLASQWLAKPVKFTGKLEPKARLRDEQRSMLMRELCDELEVLRTEYGVDVNGWSLDRS